MPLINLIKPDDGTMLFTEKDDTDINQQWHVARISDIPGRKGRAQQTT